MWKPPEKIRHQPEPGAAPTAAEAATADLFAPVRIGPLELSHRTWVPAMVPWRATDDGYVTDHVLAWYERFAKGQPGGLVIEATGIRDIPSGPLLRIGDDRFVPGLTELAQTVAENCGSPGTGAGLPYSQIVLPVSALIATVYSCSSASFFRYMV